MRMKRVYALFVCAAVLSLGACSGEQQEAKDLVNDRFAAQELEIREAVLSIKADIESSNIEALQAAHLDSEKFTKFGPRRFERQEVS